MPLQQINLDQSIYSKAIQNRMMPQGAIKKVPHSGFPIGGGLPSSQPPPTNSFVEEQKAQWAEEDKAKKAERDMKLQQAQEMGMRWGQQVQNEGAQQVQQQLAIKQQVEQNPEPAAKEMYELMKTLPDEAKSQLLQQLFTPTSTGSTINGKPISGAKYNAIAKVFLDKGWAMFDPKGNVNLSEPKEVPEKGTFTMNANGDVLNTTTGNIIYKKEDIPAGITSVDLLDIMKEARAYVTGLVDPSYIEALTPEGRAEFFANADKKFKDHVTWLLQKTYNLTLDQATAMANKLPKQEEMIPTVGGGKTNVDNTIVSDLKRLFAENPDQVKNRKAYEDKYGVENVATALGETSKPKPTTESITKEFKGYSKNFPISKPK
jgi:hypothetical protein